MCSSSRGGYTSLFYLLVLGSSSLFCFSPGLACGFVGLSVVLHPLGLGQLLVWRVRPARANLDDWLVGMMVRISYDIIFVHLCYEFDVSDVNVQHIRNW